MLRIVRRNKAQIDRLLFQIKLLVIREGKKVAWDYLINQIPTEEQIINKMKELSEKNPKEAKRYYDKTKNLLEGIKEKLESSLSNVDAMKDKLNSVDQKVTTIRTINSIVEPFIEILEGIEISTTTIINTAGASPTTPPGPIAQTATLKEKIKGTVKKTISALALASRIVTIVTRTYVALKRTIDSVSSQINQLISFIENLLQKLEQLFIDILKPLLDDLDDAPPFENLEDLYSYYPGMEGNLNSDDSELPPLLDEEDNTNTTNGISNIAPRFYKRYRTGSYTEEF